VVKNVYGMSVTIDASIFGITFSHEITNENITVRCRKLEEELQLRLFEKFTPEDAFLVVQGVFHQTLKPVIAPYLLGFYDSAIVTLHGVLERVSLTMLPHILYPSWDDYCSKGIVVEKLISRRTLSDISGLYVEMGIWNVEDQKVVQDISRKRNIVAHCDATGVSNKLFSGKDAVLPSNLHDKVREYEMGHEDIVNAVLLILKIVSYNDKGD